MTNPKVIAFYLPQFHTTEQNDEWWGKGFTEWTNTRKAKPLFQGHYQPRTPLNQNYYCLLDENVQIWQSELAEKYGIYGFCYYHYWFNGKLLLEKPMENMLKNKKIKTKFCISWANEPWTRTWTGREKEVLMAQEYGDKEDWKKHFEYLLPFFKDERYILENNRPVLFLYRTNSITNCESMVKYWDECAKEQGFDGMYIVETLTGHQKLPVLSNDHAVAEMEPMHTIRHGLPLWKQGLRLITKKLNKKINVFDKLPYDLLWKQILKKKHDYGRDVITGAFVDWDNTARWGRKAMIVTGANPKSFKDYFDRQYKISRQIGANYIVINAWNEWGEGTYLEPDEKYGCGYLQAISDVLQENA